MFAKHHYLNHSFNRSADTFVMYVNGQLAGFTSTLPFVHPVVKKTRQEHRTVILPDFQGIGLGVYLRDFIAERYFQNGYSHIITTSNPALIHSMKKSSKWICTRQGRTSAQQSAHSGIQGFKKSVSGGVRITTSWKYVGNKGNAV